MEVAFRVVFTAAAAAAEKITKKYTRYITVAVDKLGDIPL